MLIFNKRNNEGNNENKKQIINKNYKKIKEKDRKRIYHRIKKINNKDGDKNIIKEEEFFIKYKMIEKN